FAPTSDCEARTTRRPGAGMMLVPRSQPRSANAPMRQPSSKRLRGERIHDDVHGETRVIHREESFALGVVVPLRAVVFAAVQHGDAPIALNRLQVLVHEVVAPAIELVARRGWALELEER